MFYFNSGLLGIAACIRFGSVYPVLSLGFSWYSFLVTSLWTALAVGQLNIVISLLLYEPQPRCNLSLMFIHLDVTYIFH